MLETIINTKRKELLTFLPELEQYNGPHYSLKQALLKPHRSVGLIAEVKQASPSKGVFTHSFNPVSIAMNYEKAGADAISVLTDQHYFKGSTTYLKQVKATVNVPVLRKDFIIDGRQIEESRDIGADAILLIAAALEVEQLQEFYLKAYELGLECLVEVHNKQELDTVLSKFQPEIIGINNRDLKTFHTTLETTKDLLPFVPDNSVIVSESGILGPESIKCLEESNVNGALVGEALMKAETPQIGIDSLFGVAEK